MRLFWLSATCAAFLGSASHAATIFNDFTSYFATGDSLSDNGKLVDAFEAPSVGNRFSNGKVWVEHIADHFAFSRNFAVGGATAGAFNTTPYPDPLLPIGTFAGQARAVTALEPAAGSNPLVSVLFGANDIFQGLSAGTITPAAVEGFASDVAQGIRDIWAGGPQFDDFAVANLPDLGAIPAFNLPVLLAQGNLALLEEEGAPEIQIDAARNALASPEMAKTAASALTGVFNRALDRELDTLSRDVTIYRIDQFGYFENLLADPASLGLLTATLPCTANLRASPVPEDCILLPDGAGGFVQNPALADLFLFIDPVHPNRIVHEDFARFAAEEIARQVAVIPLPAGLPLLLAGLGGLALLRRR
jgi:phospholipase/lecithinase/hemolysin